MSILFSVIGGVGFTGWLVMGTVYFQACLDTKGVIDVTEFLLALIVGILLLILAGLGVVIRAIEDRPTSAGLTLTRTILSDIRKELQNR